MTDQTLDIISKILMPVGLFFFGVILNWLREDIKGIRADLGGIRKDVGGVLLKIFEHVNDHQAHCKKPTKGC